jgi:putative transposase
MTRSQYGSLALEVKELLSSDRDFLVPVVQGVLQQALEAETEERLQAGQHERTSGRLGYRSGYYGRGLITRVGRIELRVPQDRAGRFSTEMFGRYQGSEKALVAALVEMYIQGVSTRKVVAVTEELCGHNSSASSISRVVKQLLDFLSMRSWRSSRSGRWRKRTRT